jgi:predicted metal-dependent phosphoesterase TrpH
LPSRVDLHTHTTASDGTLEPAALLEKAAELSIQYLGIADHDTTAGYEAVLPLQSRFPAVQLIPSIEINAEGELSCHLLGYFFDPKNAALQTQLALYRQLRLDRARAMVEKLKGLGVSIDFEKVLEVARGGSVGRPHIADALIVAGVVRTRQQAFDRFLKKDGAAYVPGTAPSAAEAIQLIRGAGGVPVLAHPCFYTSESLVEQLVKQGLMGIEVYYPEHSKSLIRRYLEITQRLNLVATGGSDFHGPRTGRTALGCVDVPESVLESLRTAQARR